MTLTAARLRELLDYRPLTGLFYWKVSPNGRIPAGSIAGTQKASGHIVITIKKKGYQPHRLGYG